MVNLRIMPYNIGSESAKDLSQLLECMRVKPTSTTYRPKLNHKIINWGSAASPSFLSRRVVPILNSPSAVNVASNKLSAFIALTRAGVPVPEYTTNLSVAELWVRQGFTVVERHELRGNSGDGIRMVNKDTNDQSTENSLTNAPLYTLFINKSNEYRVHVFRGQVIDFIEKKRMASDRRPENFSPYISSVERGWVFSRMGVNKPSNVEQMAIKAVNALGLDFGAVDIVVTDNSPIVLEVNTAPGLSGTTLVNYANAIRRYMGVGALPEHVTQSILDRPTTTPAAVSAPVESVRVNGDLVTLTIDRATALKLRTLLASI